MYKLVVFIIFLEFVKKKNYILRIILLHIDCSIRIQKYKEMIREIFNKIFKVRIQKMIMEGQVNARKLKNHEESANSYSMKSIEGKKIAVQVNSTQYSLSLPINPLLPP
jgi:hypothetical protein